MLHYVLLLAGVILLYTLFTGRYLLLYNAIVRGDAHKWTP